MKTDVFKIKQKLFEYKYKDLELKIIWVIVKTVVDILFVTR
jgi:hypothetical protein